jgi:LemA protein
MSTTLIVILILVLLVLAAMYGASLYNGLVGLKNNVAKSWANIDVLLKQRHDELPKLIETCKRYMQYEQQTLENVIKARSAVASASRARNMDALGEAEGELRKGLVKLFAVAEAYPELKTSEQFSHLQSRISSLEGAIADRREFYNESVTLNNVGIEQFPAVLVARMFGFGSFDLLQIPEEETKDVDVKQLFGS